MSGAVDVRLTRGPCSAGSPGGGDTTVTPSDGAVDIVTDEPPSTPPRCWTAAMGEPNAVAATGAGTLWSVSELENFVEHVSMSTVSIRYR